MLKIMRTSITREALTITMLILSSLFLNGKEVFADFTNNTIPKGWRIYPKNTNYEDYLTHPLPNYYFTNKFYNTNAPSLTLLNGYFLTTDKVSDLSKIELFICGNSNTLGTVTIDYTTSLSIKANTKWINLKTISKDVIPSTPDPGKMLKISIDLSEIKNRFYIRIFSEGTLIIDDIILTSQNEASLQLNEIEKISINAVENGLEIYNCINRDITIFNINGQLIGQKINCHLNEIKFDLPKGFYIVIVDNETHKILIK